eukprot:Nitzschia sp. Nitz4//scaffold36_size144017//49171//49953//NITZ4_003081-RA/size144017-processed-gene-0.229-mRNA-1//1//CDS//3329549441//522//frame0
MLTYMLGHSLYVPLTSHSNTLTLPATRGPNFLLPRDVVSSLCRVRDLESGTDRWSKWFLENEKMTDEPKMMLPHDHHEPTGSTLLEAASHGDEARYPTTQQLVGEVQSRLSCDKLAIESIVLGGEGEPTLRMDDLVDFVTAVRQLQNPTMAVVPKIRLTTNGCVLSPETQVRQLRDVGVSAVSVALMTADSAMFDKLMKPTFGLEQGHRRVCDFIQASVQAGLEVETTGVDRPDVDKAATEALSQSLGVTSPFRWRPFFP